MGAWPGGTPGKACWFGGGPKSIISSRPKANRMGPMLMPLATCTRALLSATGGPCGRGSWPGRWGWAPGGLGAWAPAGLVSTTGRRHVGQTCCLSSQLFKHPRCRTCPHGSFFGRDRSLIIGLRATGGGGAPAAGAPGAGFVTDQGVISSLQIMQVSSRWISSSVASGYLWFISLVAFLYFRNALRRLRNERAVRNRSRIIWMGRP